MENKKARVFRIKFDGNRTIISGFQGKNLLRVEIPDTSTEAVGAGILRHWESPEDFRKNHDSVEVIYGETKYEMELDLFLATTGVPLFKKC